ncbi:MAG: amino acid adenylation domain-containing protein [Bacteroidota bacterium]
MESTLLVHHLFEQQAHATPNAVAVSFGSSTLTYSELDQKATALSLLVKRYDASSLIVGISTTRCIDMVVGVLAILKAGKAYLPLDPSLPEGRLQRVISDSGICSCLCSGEQAAFYQSFGVAAIDWQTVDNDDTVTEQIILADALVKPVLAYVLYTSGSTGMPKGVCMGHSAVVNLLEWQRHNSIAGPASNTLQFAPLGFDVSFQEIFATFSTGGTLHLVHESLLIDPQGLLNFIREQNINRIFLPFVSLQYLTEAAVANGNYPACLQEVITAGEQLKITAQVNSFFTALPHAVLYNQYGPTECHVVSELKLSGNPSGWPFLPSIGSAIDNVQLHVLDEQLQPVAAGEQGELCISGKCLAEGYLNRPELTAEKFVVAELQRIGSTKLYRTGDIARLLPDGNVEFLGRRDEQVKISGYRIETGEIEVLLSRQENIKAAVVIAREDTPGQKRLVAYLVATSAEKNIHAIRQALEKQLPEYMLPSAFVWMDELPKTTSGKVDKKALPAPGTKRPDLAELYKAPTSETEKNIAAIWSELLLVDKPGVNDNFFDLGGSSLLAVKGVTALKSRHNYSLPVAKLYQYPTISGVARSIDGSANVRSRNRAANTQKGDNRDVAVIGMSGRFPGADTIDELWNVLKEGRETVSFFTKEELDASIPEDVKNDPDYVRARGIITNADKFDAAFFNITPRQAELTDPQQRIFMELAWEVLERTGYLPAKYDGAVGVFAGIGNNTYYLNNVLSNRQLVKNAGPFQVMTLNEKDYVASRAAFSMDLKGPAVSVHAACSTSLLAICQAVQGIRAGQCEVAVAGAAAITTPIKSGHIYQQDAIYSKDGHCRPFDAEASGTVFSDGAAVVLLKDREAAERDGDTIYAVIKGIGVNNDGGEKGNFTAPSAEGQAGAIAMAMDDAGVAPRDISYIEAHGTATPLGDPIEVDGLKMAFADAGKTNYCALGSIKSNMGHLTAAAGIAGFIKTVLALHHRQIPASLNYSNTNPHIDFGQSPFYVNTALTSWESEHSRIAGISSFGVGGTNVHVIVEEYENIPKSSGVSRPAQLVCWSAKTEASAAMYAGALAQHLDRHPQTPVADIAYTLVNTRTDFNVRRFAVATDAGELVSRLSGANKSHCGQKALKEVINEVVFMFPGQGAQYAGMGKSLYNAEPVYKAAVDECAAILQLQMNEDIRDILFSDPVSDEDAANRIKNTYYTQPAMFVTEYALAKLWMSWGLKPSIFIGHSIGEFVAAHLAGVFSLEDALLLISSRGRLMADVAPGSMLAVLAGHEQIACILPEALSIAAINSPGLSVVAGHEAAVADFSRQLSAQNINSKLLHTSHAFHSAMMDPVVVPFEKVVRGVTLHAPQVPIVSTVTGTWIQASDATDPAYWAQHLRSTVRFSAGVTTLLEKENMLLLECGPGNVTATLARQHPAKSNIVVVPGIEHGADEYRSLLSALGQLWIHGVQLDWKKFYADEERVKIDLPAYQFDRKRYWVDPVPEIATANVVSEVIEQPAVIDNEQDQTADEDILGKEVRQVLEDASGIDIADATADMSFIELGFDSLLLTQVALSLKKRFSVPVSFRQLNESYNTFHLLVDHLKENLPAYGKTQDAPGIARHTALLSGAQISAEEATELKKPFGAAARIERHVTELTEKQVAFLDALVGRYTAKTAGSKKYTQRHRAHMADPRVVTGFRPLTKEIVYSIVVNRSKGSRLWDIDGNEYVDVLNGFGSNILGYSNPVITEAIHRQIEKGYELGPQHELAGEVCKLICEFTNTERSALCNTGSEALLGAMRIARTVTGRSLIVAFSGSYHGIADEVIVRGTKKMVSFPAAPGIMPEAVQNMLVLDYGTDETLKIIKERAHELAAVLVEPVQSRRPEFQPVEFLRELRSITRDSGVVLVFDEVITGFRSHPGGVQALFNIQADISTYGKVVAGGMPIGVIAGTRRCMDALDGGFWQYGDESVPESGVTYFAGTFVRHPLALAATKASLEYLKSKGRALQDGLSSKTARLADMVNGICRKYNVPAYIAYFSSLWKLKPKHDIPYFELLFTLMRERNVHIWDGFPCFVTEAHTDREIDFIAEQFEASIRDLVTAGFLVTAQDRIDIEKVAPFRPAFSGLPAAPGQSSIALPVAVDNAVTPEHKHEPVLSKTIPIIQPQQEIWLSCQLGGDDANRAYNQSVTLKLAGDVNIEAMRNAVGDVYNRHEALRAIFDQDGHEVHIRERGGMSVIVEDISSLSAEKRQEHVQAYVTKDLDEVSDLAAGPLFKAALFRHSLNEFELVLSAHHIICDGWSLGILMEDVSQLYSSYATGTSPSLEDAPAFADYAAAYLRYAASDDYKVHEQYWLDQYKANVPVLSIPTDFVRPRTRTYIGRRDDYALAAGLVPIVKRTAVAQGCSMVTILLSAFEVLLHRITGQKDIVVGLPAAGQLIADNYRLVSHCVNLLPLLSHHHHNVPFAQYLAERKSYLYAAYDHQRYTFSTLLNKLNIARDPSRIPLVPVVFNVDLGMDDNVEFYGAKHKWSFNKRNFENFELFLNISGSGEQLVLEWAYNTALFKPDTIRGFMEAYEGILRQLTENIAVKTGELKVPLHRKAIAQVIDNGSFQYDSNVPLHKLISAKASEVSSGTAVKFEDVSLTYKQVDDQANQMAQYLIQQGVTKGDIVAVAIERSEKTLLSLLAIMKAGAVYLPVDLEYPDSRIEYVITNSAAKFVITEHRFRGRFATAKELFIEDAVTAMTKLPATDPEVAVTGNDLVYILYTSGSTGNPKGVQIKHKGLVNFILSMQQQPGILASDKLLAITTISFDIAGLELFLPLISGAQVVLVSRQVAKDADKLLQVMKEEQVTVMQATPSTWRMLLDAGWADPLPVKVLTGGEALPETLAADLLPLCSSLWNMYGPTETTIWSAVDNVTDSRAVTIGKPINNTPIYILDSDLKPVPAGTAGEIFIGGDGVAHGYINRPEQTKERFLPDPFAADPAAKMYRTGDLGKYNNEGKIIYAGRVDNQVKLRGYRIELEEVECALQKVNGIKEAIASVYDNNLLAYVTIHPDADISGWREVLRAGLPSYMVPFDIVVIDRFVLTPNGKIDRKQLPEPEVLRTANKKAHVCPRNDIELAIAGIWEELLRVQQVSVRDDFFELGGHSLIGIQVMNRIHKTLGKKLPLSCLFEAPTIERLAELLGSPAPVQARASTVVPIKPGGTKVPLYIVHGYGMNVLSFTGIARNMDPDQPVYGLQAIGLDGSAEPSDKLEEIAAQYVAEMLETNKSDSFALAGYSFGGTIALEMGRQLKAKGKKVTMLAMFDAYNDSGENFRPKHLKVARKIWRQLPKASFIAQSLVRYPVETVKYQYSIFTKRVREALGVPEQDVNRAEAENVERLYRKYETAYDNYILPVYDGAIDVFKVKKRLYFIDDRKYLGWAPYAKDGVRVHEVSGDHKTFLQSPYDKGFARMLQQRMDECAQAHK